MTEFEKFMENFFANRQRISIDQYGMEIERDETDEQIISNTMRETLKTWYNISIQKVISNTESSEVAASMIHMYLKELVESR